MTVGQLLRGPCSTGQPEVTWLDDEHALEPLDTTDPSEIGVNDPVVLDAAGRMWRLRHRPAWLEAVRRLVRLMSA